MKKAVFGGLNLVSKCHVTKGGLETLTMQIVAWVQGTVLNVEVLSKVLIKIAEFKRYDWTAWTP